MDNVVSLWRETLLEVDENHSKVVIYAQHRIDCIA
jgi:hypothetical protein